MTLKDKLPVLAFPALAPKPKDRTTPRANPDDLARAIAALRGALEAEVHKPTPVEDTPQHVEESFSPVGVPTWRAGAKARGNKLRKGATDAPLTGPPTDRDSLTRRILSLHVPRFSMERWQHWAKRQSDAPPDDIPVALAIEGQHGPIIHATNRAADQQGVHVGARVVDMRALIPDLRVEFADIAGDKVALEKLMHWARRWCPWTAVDGSDGLVMDTTGSAHLWGGEAAMLREIEEKLSSLGMSANLAIAPTHGAAWALARFGDVRGVALPETLAPQVAPLPVRSLRLTGQTIQLLQRLGLKTIGDLAAVPRISLARRFSRAVLVKNPMLRMDQMMGRLPEPVSAPDDPPRFAVQSKLAEPVQDPTPHLPELCSELCKGMEDTGFGARRLTVTVYRTDGEVSHVTVSTAQASRDPAHLLRLFDDKLDRINPGFGFDLITLGATVAEHVTNVQTRLDGGVDDGAELARLVDRLVARLGTAAVQSPISLESHMPERAEGWQPAMTVAPQAPTILPHRPLRLFDHPEEIRVVYAVPEGPPAQFIWRRVTHRVTRFAGPERIAPEWWRDMPGTRLRDYYRIEEQLGRRFWLYRDGVLGDGRGQTPRWFVHGVFA